MPRIHAQLRRVTDTEPISIRPEDVIEPAPEEHDDARRKAWKRRRIENIANQYIKLGRVPLIVSAGLRGPFDDGWNNPWVTAPARAIVEVSQSRISKGGNPQNNVAVKPVPAGTRRSKLSNEQPVSSVPSPEASRAPETAHDIGVPLEDVRDDSQFEDPSTVQQESEATEFFSVDPDPTVSFEDFGSNPFWLKRPHLKSGAFGSSTNGNHDPSPTRARLGDRPVDRQGRLLLVTPKQPVSGSNLGPEPEPDWMSAASASMIMTSPAQAAQNIPEVTSSGHSVIRKRTYSKFERGSIKAHQSSTESNVDASLHAHITPREASNVHSLQRTDTSMATPNARTVHRASGVTSNNKASPSAKSIQPQTLTVPVSPKEGDDAHQEPASAPHTTLRGPKHNVERPAQLTSLSRLERTGYANKKLPIGDATPVLRHNRVTSPTLASSTGFVYRKVGETKRAKPSGTKKARAPTCSSPATVEQPPAEHETASANESHEHEPVPTTESRMERPDIFDVPGSPQEQQQQQQSHRSRTSDFSTQAALMMAQTEFQDSTMPTIAEDAPVPWMPGTAPGEPIIPSPAFTPFHKFNAALEDHALDPTMQDMPISTQDLFATISPFANSTVKKSIKVPSSNLRFSVFANREQDTPSQSGFRDARSPTSSRRKPLREKNSRVSFLGAQSEKGSQGDKASQESITPRASKAPMVQAVAVELPQLDFQKSNADLDFTDRFILNLESR